MKTYHGKRNLGVATEPGPVTVCTDGGNVVELNPRTDLVRHSEALNWGYYGSGPAQLAVALLADAVGNDALALELHQFFKEAVIAKLEDEWWLSDHDVIVWIRQAVVQARKPARVERPTDIEAAIDVLGEMKRQLNGGREPDIGDENFSRALALGWAIRALKLVDERIFRNAELPEPEGAS